MAEKSKAAEKAVPDPEPIAKAKSAEADKAAAKTQEAPVVVGQTAQEPVIFDPTNPEELADPANLPAKPDDVDEKDHGRTTSS